MIDIYIFETHPSEEYCELVGVIPLDDFIGWFMEFEFDYSCVYQFHFVKDGKLVKNI